MRSNHSRFAWIISDHQIKLEMWGSLRMALTEITRERFQWKPSGLQIGPLDSGGDRVYHSVSAKMTSVLAALGNLPLTSIILVDVPVLICQRAWKGITSEYFSIRTTRCAAVFVAGCSTEPRIKARIEWRRCLDEANWHKWLAALLHMWLCVHSVRTHAVSALILCGSGNIFARVGSW